MSDIKDLQEFRAKQELTIKVLSLLETFDSKEEPKIKLTNTQKLGVLANIISKELN